LGVVDESFAFIQDLANRLEVSPGDVRDLAGAAHMVVTLVKGGSRDMLREEETAGNRTYAKPTVGNHRLRTASGGSGNHLHDGPLPLSQLDRLLGILRDDAVHQRVSHVAFDAAVALLGRE
jgi:hypothetical protein